MTAEKNGHWKYKWLDKILASDLSDGAVRVGAWLFNRANKTGVSWHTVGTIGAGCRMNKSEVHRALRELRGDRCKHVATIVEGEKRWRREWKKGAAEPFIETGKPGKDIRARVLERNGNRPDRMPNTYRLKLNGVSNSTSRKPVSESNGVSNSGVTGCPTLGERGVRLDTQNNSGTTKEQNSSPPEPNSPPKPNATGQTTGSRPRSAAAAVAETNGEDATGETADSRRVRANLKALREAGIGEPSRTRLAKLPGITEGLVRELSAQNQVTGGGPGLIVRKLEERATALAEYGRERKAREKRERAEAAERARENIGHARDKWKRLVALDILSDVEAKHPGTLAREYKAWLLEQPEERRDIYAAYTARTFATTFAERLAPDVYAERTRVEPQLNDPSTWAVTGVEAVAV
jgi:hypothetical protein